MTAPNEIEDADRAFAEHVDNLRRVANQWISRPIAPEAEVISALIVTLDQIGMLAIEARRASIRSVTEARLIAEQQRRALADDTVVIREQLRDGIEAVHTLRTINEKLVEKKLLTITADMTKGLRGAIESQATAMTRRYNLQTAFRILGYSSIVLIAGFALGRMP